jgi:hypothetical protein
MKKLVLVSVALFSIGLFNNSVLSAKDKPKETPGDLTGELPAGPRAHSIVLPPSFSTFSTSALDIIEVSLSQSLGEVSVLVSDEFGNIVYEEVVNASAQSSIYINTALFAAGEYSVWVVNSKSQYLERTFVIESSFGSMF